MRSKRIGFGCFCCWMAVVGLMASTATAADESSLEGRWKLVVMLPFIEYEFGLLEIKSEGDKLTAEIKDVNPQLGPKSVKKITDQQGNVTVTFDENAFVGRQAAEGKQAGQVLGSYHFRGNDYVARLEKTEAEKVGPAQRSPLRQQFFTIRDMPDAGQRVTKLAEMAANLTGPSRAEVTGALLESAADADLSGEQVQRYLDAYFADADQYGTAAMIDSRTNALRALDGAKPYTQLSLKLAQQVEKSLPESVTTEQTASVVQALASAARGAGEEALAAASEARLEKLEAKLDEEYHEKVPPFKPEAYAGRSKPDQDRVVLLELFTGAQCPPCVAADVAFDALIDTYKSAELVTLQYHLHIPGPDPLTNEDSISRSKYYAVRGTPSTYFNGKTEAGGGGAMDNAREKYEEYRQVIDPLLDESKAATIELKVSRSGNKLMVDALANLVGKEKADEQRKLRLHLVLTEESIRYVGGNKLRFHHHVVRDFLGDVNGQELVAGQVEVNQPVDLDEVRTKLEAYLKTAGPFPKALPNIALKNLSVVAFIQDDADKSVLHAVTAKVPAAE